MACKAACSPYWKTDRQTCIDPLQQHLLLMTVVCHARLLIDQQLAALTKLLLLGTIRHLCKVPGVHTASACCHGQGIPVEYGWTNPSDWTPPRVLHRLICSHRHTAGCCLLVHMLGYTAYTNRAAVPHAATVAWVMLVSTSWSVHMGAQPITAEQASLGTQL